MTFLFRNILIAKEFLECIAFILGYLRKINSGLGLVYGSFFRIPFYENFDQTFFVSQNFKHCVFKFLLRYMTV